MDDVLKVSWSDVKFTVEEKEILRGLTGAASPGRALAILGASGAGKTTFLNTLANRLETNSKKVLTGEVLIGNSRLTSRYSALLGYVTQDDIVGAYETPASALYFSVRTRCGLDPESAQARVDELLKELNLINSRDTIVGIPGLVAGLSGGERKRVNIGIELVANTKILLLDEPTSGLDSVTAENVVELLQSLSRSGYTVIYTLHQPTARAFSLFDDLLLMALGKAVYHGPASLAITYFEGIDHPCPEHYTPTDYFMKLLQDPTVAPLLVEKWEGQTYGNPVLAVCNGEGSTAAELDGLVRGRGSSLAVQTIELLKRSFRQVFLNRIGIMSLFVQSLFFSIIAGLLFINLKHTVTGVQDTLGALFMVVINRSFGGVTATINTFTPQKAEFIREQKAGAYSPTLFLVTKIIAEFPLNFVAEAVSAIIVYFMLDLDRNAAPFFVYLATLLFLSQVARSLGLLISAAAPNVEVGSSLAPAVVVPLMLAGGLFLTTSRLRPYWYWLEKPSFIRYGFVILTHNQFNRVGAITCEVEKFGAAFCNATYRTGAEVLQSFELDDAQDQPFIMWISLTAMFVLTTLFSIVALTCVGRTKF